MNHIDFNSDLGESFGDWHKGADEEMLACVTSANVACGFHAGDPVTMRSTVAKVGRHGVALGAHPGYPDLLGFGRRRLAATPTEVAAYVTYQIGALSAFAVEHGIALHHVKSHGALYAATLVDGEVAAAVADATAALAPGVALYTLHGSAMWTAAERSGLRPVAEFYADRPVEADGSYRFFGWQGVFDLDPDRVAERAARAAVERRVTTLAGNDVEVAVDSICLHSDTPGAGALGPRVREALEGAGVRLIAP